MELKTFALTMGVGMAAGATVALILPKGSKARRVAQKTANRIEDAVEDAVDKATCCMKH